MTPTQQPIEQPLTVDEWYGDIAASVGPHGAARLSISTLCNYRTVYKWENGRANHSQLMTSDSFYVSRSRQQTPHTAAHLHLPMNLQMYWRFLAPFATSWQSTEH